MRLERTVRRKRMGGTMRPMAAAKRFGGYKKESQREERTRSVSQSKTILRLHQAWIAYREGTDRLEIGLDAHDKQYELSQLVLKLMRIRCSPATVQRLMVSMTQFQEDDRFSFYAGTFISACVNNGRQKNYPLSVGHFTEPLNRLGYRNRKNLRISGKPGYHLGKQMESGMIVVEGDAENVGECMKGGRILVKGDAGQQTGHYMEGGEIVVEGDAKEWTGSNMKGGKIHIRGGSGLGVGKDMEGGQIIIGGDVTDTLGEGMIAGHIRIMGNAGEKIGGRCRGFMEKPMSGGQIHVEGEIGSISEYIEGGRIFHRGKLIVDK
jgi:formylmethanofuran dehydrogenase subunit C